MQERGIRKSFLSTFSIDCGDWLVGVGTVFVMLLHLMMISVCGVCLNQTTESGGHLVSQT